MSTARDGGAAGGQAPGAARPAGGHIEVITGGMFSGKSEELVRRLRRAVIARQRVMVFKPAADLRTAPERLVTRDKRELDAVAVATSRDLQAHLEPDVEVIGIDEAQFFDDGLVHLLQELADRGLRVIVAGLDLDYRRRPFGPMPELLAIAEYVDKMHAVCVRCGSPAQYSQRIAGPEDQFHLGDTESYEARCRACYEAFRVRVAVGERGAESGDRVAEPVAGSGAE
jgi:thymidine kinase